MPAEGSVADKIEIQINGQAYSFDAPLLLNELLDRLKINNTYTAVAVNGEIVSRSQIAKKMICNGDTLDAIRAVAGG